MKRIDLSITIALGGRSTELGAAELAEVLGLEPAQLRSVLLALLHGRPVGTPGAKSSPQEEGDSRGRSLLALRERNGNLQNRSEPFGEEGGPGEETPRPVDNSERLADYLADVFRDDKSLAFYKLVAATVPREVVRDALHRALDVPRHEVRRSRAAIFTALLRPYLPRRRLPPRGADTSS